MKETGMMFKAPLVRAILLGQKWQTRRIVKTKNGGVQPNPNDLPGMKQIMRNCPFGKPGDRIYVRETWQHANFPYGPYQDETTVFYRADYLDDPHGPDGEKSEEGKYRHWQPSIHMPKSAARIWLELTRVRLERLHLVSEADCIAEGIEFFNNDRECGCKNYMDETGKDWTLTPRQSFQSLWESTGADWDANPWVWALEFKRIPALDQRAQPPLGSPAADADDTCPACGVGAMVDGYGFCEQCLDELPTEKIARQ